MTTDTTPDNASPRKSGNSSFLPALYALSFCLSVGTGIVTSGVYFLTTEAYRFGTRDNYLLGFFQGLTYVIAAVFAGRVVRAVRARLGLSSRAILVVIISSLGLLCMIPLLAVARDGGSVSSWPIWVMVLVYSPLTGFLWPLVENYVSGGRSGVQLRRALGSWNLFWSSSLVFGFFLLGPLVGRAAKGDEPASPGPLTPQQLIATLGAIHLLTTLLLLKVRKEPGQHIHEEYEPHPPVYRELLGTFRILLPTSYFVLTALQPYMPVALESVGVGARWLAPFAAVWHVARVLTFFALDRWHGWHGKWWLAIASIVLLISGFAAIVLGPRLDGQAIATTVCLLGLFAFGTGMAMTYTAALYYVMEVGQADIDAGGSHESLIGLGYTLGPGAGLAVSFWTADASKGKFELSVVVLVGALALASFLFAAWMTHLNVRRAAAKGVSR